MRPGGQVGRYVLVREVARGGMGVVFEARGADGARVALKVLTNVSSKDALGRFERERRLLAELSAAHGFVPLLDAGEAQGRPWLVMAFMEGGSLRERLARGPMSVDAAVELGHQLGMAIGRAHARGIVHRDLKPENVLFERAGDDRARIADLGIAKHFRREGVEGARSVSLSASGLMLGTACYMAPEQLQDAKAVGPAADVFALAQIVYECVAGLTPFQGESLDETLAMLIDGRPVPLRERVPAAPAWLEAALARALATDPAERWADGRAFARALSLGERAVVPGRGGQAARRRVVVAAVVGGAVGVAALVGAVVLLRARGGAGPGAAAGAGEVATAGAGAGADADAGADAGASPATSAGAGAGESAGTGAGTLAGAGAPAGAGAGAATEVTPAPEPTGQRPAPPEVVARLRHAVTVREAARAGEAGDRERALSLADAVLAEDPSHELARAVRAAFTGGLERVELDRLIAAGPEAWLLATRAVVRLDERDFEGARDDCDRALRLDAPTAWRLFLRAEAHLGLGELDAATSDAEASLRLGPDEVVPWLVLAEVGRERSDAPGLRAAARGALALDDDDAGVWFRLGNTLFRANEYEAACEAFDRAAACDPTHANAHLLRGWARLAVGRVTEGNRDLERAIELGIDAGALHVLATAYLEQGALREARDAATRAIAQAPDDARFFALRGAARQQLGDLPGARADLDRLLALDPGAAARDPWATRAVDELAAVEPGVDPGPTPGLDPRIDHEQRASALLSFAMDALQGGDPARTVALCDEALALTPDRAPLLALRGTCRPGAEGLPDLDRAIAVGPVQPYMFVNRADRRAIVGDLRGAIDDLGRALAMEPPRPFTLVRRADLRLRAGEVTGATEDVRAALELDRDDAVAWKFLARCLLASGAPREALDAAGHSAELDPRDAEAWAEVALAHVALSAWSEAIAAAERALGLTPEARDALRARGLARERQGDRAGARADLERVIELTAEGQDVPKDVREALARLRE